MFISSSCSFMWLNSSQKQQSLNPCRLLLFLSRLKNTDIKRSWVSRSWVFSVAHIGVPGEHLWRARSQSPVRDGCLTNGVLSNDVQFIVVGVVCKFIYQHVWGENRADVNSRCAFPFDNVGSIGIPHSICSIAPQNHKPFGYFCQQKKEVRVMLQSQKICSELSVL